MYVSRGKLLQVMQRLVHNLNKNPTMVIKTIMSQTLSLRTKIHNYGAIVRIEFIGVCMADADDIICKVAADIFDENPNYRHSALDLHDGSSGRREGLITFFEDDGII